jgi:hypothetical protein
MIFIAAVVFSLTLAMFASCSTPLLTQSTGTLGASAAPTTLGEPNGQHRQLPATAATMRAVKKPEKNCGSGEVSYRSPAGEVMCAPKVLVPQNGP